jgi:hypothetical protein
VTRDSPQQRVTQYASGSSFCEWFIIPLTEALARTTELIASLGDAERVERARREPGKVEDTRGCPLRGVGMPGMIHIVRGRNTHRP